MSSCNILDKEWIGKFWDRVDKTSDPEECWLWKGCKTGHGYGNVCYKGKMYYAHRIAYSICNNILTEGLHLAHSEKCINKRHCCNPAHLTLKTNSENQQDRHRDKTINTKLTPADVLSIRATCEKTHRELACKFNVSTTLISRVINRKTWKHRGFTSNC